MRISAEQFGILSDGRNADLITIENDHGVICKITNYGGIIVSWIVPDKDDNSRDIVLGWDDLKSFEDDTSYLGAILGRFANRIDKGFFILDEAEYRLAVNQAPNHLHGGLKALNKVLWNYSLLDEKNRKGVKLSYLSHHLEEGYPGNLNITVNYWLTNDNELILEYEATSDKKTIINLSNHAYFNLTGGEENILKHQLMICADKYTVNDAEMIPTGEIKPVKGTFIDFTQPVEIGKRIKKSDIGGYDHNFVLNKQFGNLEKAAEVFEPKSGLLMEVLTTQPGMQLYSSIHFDGSITGRKNIKYTKSYGFCLETQHFPDSPNKPEFPSTILNPWETFAQTTIYKVTAKQK